MARCVFSALIATVLHGFLLSPSAAHAAEPQRLDCARPRNAIETQVCASPALVALDAELARMFAARGQVTANKAMYRRVQEAWRKSREEWCGSKAEGAERIACLDKSYRDYMAHFRANEAFDETVDETAGPCEAFNDAVAQHAPKGIDDRVSLRSLLQGAARVDSRFQPVPLAGHADMMATVLENAPDGNEMLPEYRDYMRESEFRDVTAAHVYFAHLTGRAASDLVFDKIGGTLHCHRHVYMIRDADGYLKPEFGPALANFRDDSGLCRASGVEVDFIPFGEIHLITLRDNTKSGDKYAFLRRQSQGGYALMCRSKPFAPGRPIDFTLD